MGSNKTPTQGKTLLDVISRAARGPILKNESLVLGLLIISILAVQAVVLSRGFVSVSIDEYSRVLLSASWAESPSFMFGGIWLPGHFYLLGLTLKIHHDLFLTPRIVTMIFSLVSLGMLYLLARKLFNQWAALLSVLIVGLLRIHVYVSLTPLADVISYAFIISFLYFFLIWLDSGADRHLLIAAFMLGLANWFRYEGWFTTVVFSLYLGFRWLTGLWRTRSLRPMWLLAISLACLLPCSWIVRNYVVWGDPFHFLKMEGLITTTEGIGPLTDLFPMLVYVELLLQEGALICLLAAAGIMLSRRFLAHRVWLYLAFSLAPLVTLTLFTDGSWSAYAPRYVGMYVILLSPFCAYTIYWAITAHRQSFRRRWQTAGWKVLLTMCVYNLWVVYLRLSQKYSGALICLLALAGIALSYQLLARRHWLCLTFSLSPLPVFMIISRSGFASVAPGLHTELYFVFLTLFYAYNIWRAAGVLKPLSYSQWRLVGLGLLATICLYNSWGTLFGIPRGGRAANQASWLVRQLFEEGALAVDDKVLVEVADLGTDYYKDHKRMQVVSNHPGNFILDRDPYGMEVPTGVGFHAERESFILDKNSSPHEVGATFVHYEAQLNPFSLDPSLTLDEYLKNKQVRLVIIRDPRLEALLVQQTEFERIGQVGNYLFYYAAESE